MEGAPPLLPLLVPAAALALALALVPPELVVGVGPLLRENGQSVGV